MCCVAKVARKKVASRKVDAAKSEVFGAAMCAGIALVLLALVVTDVRDPTKRPRKFRYGKKSITTTTTKRRRRNRNLERNNVLI